MQRIYDFASDAPFDEKGALEEINTNILGVIRAWRLYPWPDIPFTVPPKRLFILSLCRHVTNLRDTSVHVVELAPPWVATDLDAAEVLNRLIVSSVSFCNDLLSTKQTSD